MNWAEVAAAASIAGFVLLVLQLLIGAFLLGHLMRLDKNLGQAVRYMGEFTAWLASQRK